MLSALFMYSLIHESTNVYVPCCCLGGKWRHPLSSGQRKRRFFFFVIASWNWILFESSFHKRPWPMHVVQRPKGQRKACSAFVSVPDWLDVNLTLSLRRPNNKKGWKTRGASGRGFPQPPSLISFTADRVIWKKWGSGGATEKDGR